MSALPKRKRGHRSVLSLLRQREYNHQSNGYVDSIQHCLLRWMLTHLSPSPYALLELNSEGIHSQTPPTLTRTSVSCLEFDALGVLLAAGGIDGSISLFDFDIYFHQTLNLDQRASELEEQGTDEPSRNVPTEPIHVIQTGHHVRCIRWNPSNQV
uniref:Uncharacterized protein AlNc14C74G5005 n=1 Tax=Albugo laibachii Nc14 TaxID=890382 RepID=F0WEE8_9STRA|nr:conserved hypothetical protein [Albugo laibachii Nc14]|eukprot:CCA19580.1 conserved hypothetical protein [Albugo laibachii Nc14]